MQNETSLRVLYLYKILMRYSDVDHPLSTNQVLQYFNSMYGIQMHRTTVSKYVELLCSSGMDVVEIRSRSKKYYINDRTFDLPELKLLIDAVQASRFISAKKSEALVEKLTSLASEESKEELRRNLINTSKVKSENEKTYYIIDAINRSFPVHLPGVCLHGRLLPPCGSQFCPWIDFRFIEYPVNFCVSLELCFYNLKNKRERQAHLN